MGNTDLSRASLLLVAVAFQLQVLTMTTSKYSTDGTGHGDKVVKYCLITSYLLFMASLVLTLLINFSRLGGNIAAIVITAIMTLLAGATIIIALAFYGDYQSRNPATRWNSPPYTTTTFVTAAASGLIASVLLFASLYF